MEVIIMENDGGKFVARYLIVISGLNYTPADEEYYSEAWKCAIADEVVNPNDREKYKFSISKE